MGVRCIYCNAVCEKVDIACSACRKALVTLLDAYRTNPENDLQLGRNLAVLGNRIQNDALKRMKR